MMEFLSKVKGKNGSMLTKVNGVDFSKELCNIADDNMKKLGIRSKAYHSDASTFNMYHNYTYFYMFNPVKGVTLKRTIKKNIDNTPVTKRNKIRIIYCNPWSEEILLGQGFIVDKNLASYAKAYKLQV